MDASRFSGLEEKMESVNKKYDLIIVGGGIYGMMLAMEAKAKNLIPLLLEKHRFGHATSSNSLQIIHGGLRYLQTLSFRRHQNSVNERAWFMRTFPDLIQPLPVLFPLYNRGLHRKSIFHLALYFDRCLSYNRNLRPGRILDNEETIALFPNVERKGLRGAALWYDDAVIVDQDELMKVILQRGGTALHSHHVQKLLISQGRVQGVVANGTSFKADVVVNTTGPWCRSFAQQVDRDIPQLFHPSLAFNILFERPPLSTHAVAVTPHYPGARTYFLRALNNQLFAGTYHMPWKGPIDTPNPPEQQIESFLSDLNQAIPSLYLRRNEIKSIRAGFLPAKHEGTPLLADRDVIINHGQNNGPIGLYSVSGVKWTTARSVAEKTLRIILKTKI